MKKISSCLLIVFLLAAWLGAVELEILPQDKEVIEIQLENIHVNEVDFYRGKLIKASSENPLAGEYHNGILTLRADQETEISLKLPKHREYKTLLDDSLVCTFSQDEIVVQGTDEFIRFTKNSLVIRGDDGETIKVNDRGIFITGDDGEEIQVTEDGIIVQEDGKEERIEGFWGNVLGGTIRAFIKPFMNEEPKTYIVKILNKEDVDFSLHGD